MYSIERCLDAKYKCYNDTSNTNKYNRAFNLHIVSTDNIVA